jgi:hypothetical protein
VSPPGSWYERAFAGSVGQVSGTFLKDFSVGLDFDRMVMTLMEPEQFEYAGGGRPIPWEPLGFGPWGIPVTLQHPDGLEFEMTVLMDLGYNSQLQIVTGGDPGFPMPENTLVTRVDRGAGVEVFHLGRLPSVTIGGYQVRDVLVSLLPEDHNTRVFSDVMLGLNLLSRFNVVYDYPRQRMFLEPNSRFELPFEYNMSGFGARPREGGALEIIEVYPDSPAQEAGLAAGDLVSEINGRPVDSFDLMELRDLWRQEGAMIGLRVIHLGKEREVTLRLRPLI